jgi:peptidoglycan/LPS O-acetylase OafA/YrhL
MIRTAKNQPFNYMPQLDGLRAFAVFAVLIQHFLLPIKSHPLIPKVSWGHYGVLLFFVLSGFLITRILLKLRGEPKGSALRIFYTRRMLRIFPIYYLTIFFFAVLGYAPIRNYLIWHLLYLSNNYLAIAGENVFEFAGHFWSLCVEEQFYLFWAPLILIAPIRRMHRFIWFAIGGAVLFRLMVTLFGVGPLAANRTVIGCLDSLGLGALLAFYWNNPNQYNKQKDKLVRFGLLIGIPLFVATIMINVIPLSTSFLHIVRLLNRQVTTDFFAALAFVAIVDLAARNSLPLFGKVLQWQPIRFIGKISYGIYIYHLFLLIVIPKGDFSRFLLLTSLTIGIATLSYHFIENPINKLKSHFPYMEKPDLEPQPIGADYKSYNI